MITTDAPTGTDTRLPLARFKVLDLTHARAGPTAAKQLGDWGAQVIKIEGRDAVEIPAPRNGSDFQNLHRNKRSLTLDLKQPEGLELFYRLVRESDVVIENYRPDVKFRLKIDYETLKAINPRIVYGSISGFGQDGPYRARPGVDPIMQGMGGLMSITGEPDSGPTRVGIAISDVASGIMCAMGILVALLEREESGQGQWVQASLMEALITMLDFQAARYLVSGEVPGRVGNNHPTMVPSGTFETADGMINIAATGTELYRRFCKAVGADYLLDDPDYAGGTARLKNRDRLNEIVAGIIKKKPSAEWVEKLNDAGVPCGPIYTMDQVFADPQVKHIGIAQPVDSKALGRINLVGQGVRMSRSPSKLRFAAPERGEHTEDVLRELGLDDASIAKLRESKVV